MFTILKILSGRPKPTNWRDIIPRPITCIPAVGVLGITAAYLYLPAYAPPSFYVAFVAILSWQFGWGMAVQRFRTWAHRHADSDCSDPDKASLLETVKKMSAILAGQEPTEIRDKHRPIDLIGGGLAGFILLNLGVIYTPLLIPAGIASCFYAGWSISVEPKSVIIPTIDTAPDKVKKVDK